VTLAFDRRSIESISDNTFVPGNSVTLLHKTRDSFNAIFDAIREARDVICLQFYIFRNDETGTEVADLLKEKAKAGVRVYLLYDHFGSFGTPASFWKGLEKAGISIRASRPFKWSSPFHYVQRDHRKLLIIDGRKVFTGGLNIANEYRGFHLRMKEGWRDTGIMLRGPIAPALFRIFMATWKTWGGGNIPLPDVVPSQGVPPSPDNNLPVIPIFASSAKGRRKMRKLLYYSFRNARASIRLTTAYFTPSRRMIDTLEESVQRGVDVRLLLPGISDVPAARYAGRASFSRLLRAGVKISTYQGEVLHAKTSVFDGYWSIVGSANLDFLSLRRNDEGNVGILDEGFGRKMNAVFEDDLTRSTEIREEDWAGRPLREKIKERFFVLFRRRL